MRVEDLDPGRSRPEFVDSQLDDLRWLGLAWDEGPDVGGSYGPYLQSERGSVYDSALETLAAQHRLFHCFCSRREIAEAASAPHSDEGPVYPGTCRSLHPDQIAGMADREFAVRMVVPDGSVAFNDAIAGSQIYVPAEDTGAFVVRRKDGVAAYQLAVAVDDAAMQITHVLRGADLLSSTARQILIYRYLGLPEPQWAHVPLLLGTDGERLSKRNGAASLAELREAGVDPAEVVGWLAWSCGLTESAGKARPEELVDAFDIGRIPSGPTLIDRTPFRT